MINKNEIIIVLKGQETQIIKPVEGKLICTFSELFNQFAEMSEDAFFTSNKTRL